MIKISALNEESSEESEEEDVPTITKEAQEQIALTEYNKALELLKENKQVEALNIFKDLLDTELLDNVEKPEIPDGRTRPMLSLKYSCFKNIGTIEAACGNYEGAIQNYWEAANLDESDVMLWYRIGMLAMETSNLELACASFKQGLKCNSNHWPCLDNMITTMYAVPDYMNCLLYISMALERDPNYVKGLAFRDQIFKEIPCLQECYKLYNSDWQLDPPLSTEYDHELGDRLIAEAKEVAKKWMESCKVEFMVKPLPVLALQRPVTQCTWLDLGESLLDMHKYISENNFNFVSHVRLTVLKCDEKIEKAKLLDECNMEECNNMEVDQQEDVKEINNLEKTITIENENVNIQMLDENRAFNGTSEAVMDIEAEDDKKSCSTDVQIIEDDDTLRATDIEIEGNGEKEQHGSAVDEVFQVDTGAQNEKSSDKESDKSSDRPYNKSVEKGTELTSKMDDKSNEKTEGKEEGQKVKKRRRSALCFLQQWAWSCSSMRRSARVRSSNRREVERDDVLLEETLRRMFPRSLLPDTVKLTKDDPSKSMDDSMDTMDLYQLFANQENNGNTEGVKSSDSSKAPSPDVSQHKYFGTELEALDVETFINEHSGKNNLMIILARFTEFLCTKWNQRWPDGLSEIYLQAYSFTRQHIPHPPPFDDDSNDSILKLDVEMTLLFGELHTDRWLDNKPDVLPSSTLDKFGTGLPSEELGHIIFTSVRNELWNDENIFILLRVLWLKANIFLCQGDVDIVIETLELLVNRMKELESQQQNICLFLPNCKCNSQISTKIVEKRLTSIQRGQKLGEIQNLYNEKKYVELSYILQDTFKFAKQRHKFLTINENIIDRVVQLNMLLDSLWQLQQYEECYVWAEACLNEAWQNYLNASEEIEQKKWTGSILNCLQKLEACTHEVSAFVVKYLPESRLTRLVQNLVHIVCHQLDVSETTVELPLETVLPWILLHYILQYEEDKERAKSVSSYTNKQQNPQHSESDDEDEGIPASIMILFTAHEFIGRHSWCCFNDAKLLFFTMNLVIPKLYTPQYDSFKDKLTKYLEQIFYCLYGHSNRVNKARPKYLEDHNVPQMELTWEGAQLLYTFYEPKSRPTFQSPRPSSISVDTEVLFKRIIKLVPPESDPNLIAEEMTAYIIGERDKIPAVKKTLPHTISDIYYLLGDFYFKNSKWIYASRYYLLDLCVSQPEMNSWAGLAMSTGTIIENWLNSYRPLNEVKFLSKAKIAQSSYRHAIELDPAHTVIWTEYGSFVYMVHSFCSRLLKQESDTLSMERFAILESRKEEMLEIADHCFQSCNRIATACQDIEDLSKIHDERWLYQYMLGKVAEKKNLDPPIFLEYYARASELLYQNNAQYPRRISHKSPQNLSIEALEVHYRIHASILKYLEQHESKPLKKSLGELFQWHLKNCSESPFMKYQSKLVDKRKEDFSDAESKIFGKEMEDNMDTEKGASINQRSNSIEEIEIIDKPNKKSDTNRQNESRGESRKRSPDDFSNDNTKRIKLGNISHLQLMQDVVALIDDLITKVCEMVPEKEKEKEKVNDDVMVLSSDESNEAKSQKRKTERDVDKIKQLTSEENVKDLLGSAEKTENVQDLMDALMKQAMEISQETQQSSPDDEDTRKFEGKWLQNEDLQATDKDTKYKTGDKRKAPNGIAKEEVTLSRRGSQESTTTTQTTTTTTETNNSSSSSSDESSSSEDSSESDSSSDSDSESGESENDKKKKGSDIEEKEEYMTEEEVNTLIAYCLAGLEQCILRFSEHYKSFYRLSHFFFNYKSSKDTSKCKDLLLGTYHCQFYPGQSFQGLFADRKSTNFFSGVWHIPNREIDRPGSFASHMSRCVTLLMQVLKETNDSRMLMQLCIQLGKIPDPDKKYLRDSEREQLSRQALTLCLQSLRSRVQSMGLPNTIDSVHLIRADARTQVLLDVYKIYQQVQKHFQHKESTVQAFSTLLIDTYKTYIGNKDLEGNVLEMAIKCCQRQILANKIATTNTAVTNVPAQVTPVNTVTIAQPIANSTSPQSVQNRKPYKNLTTGRPRGRPPNINKYLQAMQQSGNLMNQFGTKSSFSNYMPTGSRPLMNPYFMNPLVDPNMLSAILASGLGGNMMDPLSAMSYLNQVGNYQDILRQYQSNLTSLSNLASGLSSAAASVTSISSVPTLSTSTPNTTIPSTMSNLTNNLTVQQLLNLSTASSSVARSTAPTYNQAATKSTATTASFTKDRPNISITPVNTTVPPKTSKPCKQSPQNDNPLPVHIPKSLQISQASKPVTHPSTTQVSLLKPSVIQRTKSPPKQISAPQIRVSKSLTEPQPAHNPSLSHSPLKNSSAVSSAPQMPQMAHAALGIGLKQPQQTQQQSLQPMIPNAASRAGTSLQHKLLSKKNSQRAYPQTNIQNPIRRQKPAKGVSMMSSNLSSLLSSVPQPTAPPFVPPELSGISVSPVTQTGMKLPGYKKTTQIKSKPSGSVETGGAPSSSLPSAFSQANSVEALSMLTQLQQHSHLEIIPQQKTQIKPSIDFTKNTLPQKVSSETLRPAVSDCVSMYDLQRAASSNKGSAKRAEKHANDSVEIITLDD